MVSSLHFLLQCSFWMSVSRRHCALDPVNVSHTHIHREPAVLRGHMAKWGRGPGVSQDWCAAVEAPGRRGRVEGQRAAPAGQTGGVHGGSAHKSTHHVLVDLTFRWFEKKPQTNNKKKTNKMACPSTIKICPFTQIGQAAKEEARFLSVTCCCSC